MSAKSIQRPMSQYQVLSQTVARAWISAGWRDNPVTRVVPPRQYNRKDNKRAIACSDSDR